MLRLLSLSVALVALMPLPMVSAADIPGTSRIGKVMVFPSGAEITRTAKVNIPAGEHAMVFEDLPAQALASSIRVEGTATGDLEIGSVDTRRVHLSRDDAAALAGERKTLEDEIEKLRDARKLLDGEVNAAQTQKSLLTNLANLPNRPAPAGGHGGSAAEDWPALIALIGTGLMDVEARLKDAQVKIRQTDRDIRELQKKLSELAPKREEVTRVRVLVTAGSDLEADLSIRYQVSNASWTPHYTARLSTGSKTKQPALNLTRLADITQHTGEPWSDVTVVLSTTRPTAGTDTPELKPMTVDFKPPPQPRPPRPMAAPAPQAESRGLAMSDEARPGGARQMSVARARPRKKRAAVRQSNVVKAPFQALFQIPGRVTVEDNGTAKRVQISQSEVEPVLGVRTVPKLDPTAYLYAEMKIPKGAPLLPGKVTLFRDGTFVGAGRIPLLVGAQTHKLGFGIDDLVRVRHDISQDRQGETGLISSSRTDNRGYRISVKNLHERAMQVRVLDHMPVSKNEEIKVELTGKTAPTTRDVDNKRGVVAWDLNVGPEDESIIDFGYRVSWPAAREIRYR